MIKSAIRVTSAFVVLLAGIAQGQETQRLYLSGHGKDDAIAWRFQCTTGAQSGVWTNLPVPSNWELHGFGTLNYKKDSTNAWDEHGLYEHDFVVPADWSSSCVFLVFDGVMTDTSAKVNGQSAGPLHQGGFYRFKYDVTKLLNVGATNRLEVEVAKHSANESVNKAERLADYWVFGGIYRPVYLEAVPQQFIERVAVDARDDGTLTMDVFAKGVTNADSVEAQVTTLDGQPLGSVFSTALRESSKLWLATRITPVLPWTAESPNLYYVEVRLKQGETVLHQIRQRFGFRTMEIRAGDGLYVNDRKIVLKGVNRHSFWPESGRCLSEAVHRLDIQTIKDMNGNAVRMSHYPPDEQFLDLCDELGLYVLDELAGWHNNYDNEIGPKLVEEMVTRDVNHPCVIFWDNGNEGGFNTNLDHLFQDYDPQRRSVLHPWAMFSGVNTAHYLAYSNAQVAATGAPMNYHAKEGREGLSTNLPSNWIYLPTEFMHGLYDGGAGAGLEDYWRMMMASPRCAGGFIWALTDDGVKRPDTGQIDTAGNQAPDGIVGPYREREGSFYTIKELWSPIVLTPDAAGALQIQNRYSFTDANQCRFTWELWQFSKPGQSGAGHSIVSKGNIQVLSIPPGASAPLPLKLPPEWKTADALAVRVNDPSERELWTWTWPLSGANRFREILAMPGSATTGADESEHELVLHNADLRITLSKDTGLLISVARGGQVYSLSNGPRLIAGDAALTNLTHGAFDGGYRISADYTGDLISLRWLLRSNGWFRCDYQYRVTGARDSFGVAFKYPESQVHSKRWLGDGPYRVWKNRRTGVTLDVWGNKFNDTITGYRGWVYPEFKGCFANVRWLQLQTTEGPITVVPERGDGFVQVLTPGQPPDDLVAKTKVNLPECGLAFLNGIPPIGTKFKEPSQGGPQGQPNQPNGAFSGSVSFYFGELH